METLNSVKLIVRKAVMVDYKKNNMENKVLNYLSVSWNQFWFMVDLDNGHTKGNGYIWVFKTKKEAIEHRRRQHKKKFGSKLSVPIKINFKKYRPKSNN
jgi:hypothetical protein